MKKLGKVTKGGGGRVLESWIRSWEANRLWDAVSDRLGQRATQPLL